MKLDQSEGKIKCLTEPPYPPERILLNDLTVNLKLSHRVLAVKGKCFHPCFTFKRIVGGTAIHISMPPSRWEQPSARTSQDRQLYAFDTTGLILRCYLIYLVLYPNN